MKIKYILLCLMLILLTGCNAKYTLTINEDNSSSEKLMIAGYKKYYDEASIPEVINSIFNDSKDVNYYSDNYLVIERKMKEYVNLYNNAEISNYFGKVDITSNRISFEPDYDKCIFLFSDGGEFVTNDKISINLNIPFNVINSNADKVTNNTYTWTYGINDCKKTAFIEFDNSGISILTIVFIVLLLTITVVFVVIKKKQ